MNCFVSLQKIHRVMALKSDKPIKKFYAISEVAEMFNVTETLLRFWEKEFPSIKPQKSGRNIRQYTQEDIDEIGLIYNMVKVRGMKLAAARDALDKNRQRESGTAELINRLQDIREQIVALKRELEEIV